MELGHTQQLFFLHKSVTMKSAQSKIVISHSVRRQSVPTKPSVITLMLKQAVFKFPAEQSCVKFQPVIYKPKYTWNALHLKTQTINTTTHP